MQSLLAEPAAVELLLHAPTAGRIINPILRMLGIGPFAPRQRPVREPPTPRPAPARRPAFPHPREDDDTPRCSGFPWHLLLKPPQPAPT